MHIQRSKEREKNQNKDDPEPENLLNNGTSHGMVSIAVPSSPNALVRSRAWPWHLQQQQVLVFFSTTQNGREHYNKREKRKIFVVLLLLGRRRGKGHQFSLHGYLVYWVYLTPHTLGFLFLFVCALSFTSFPKLQWDSFAVYDAGERERVAFPHSVVFPNN